MSVITVREVSVKYRHAMVLEDISFSVEAGEYVGVVGPNGSGKSTLIKTILGLQSVEKGQVELMGTPLASFRDWQRVGYLPQSAIVNNKSFPATVAEVVATGLLAAKRFPRRVGRQDRQQVEDVLAMLGITELHKELIGNLSGGQSQRVFLARAMVARPDILILDEPTAALDPATRESFYETVAHLNKDYGTTILLITHDSATIGKYASKMLYVDGRLVFFGSFADFCHSQDMSQYFGNFAQHLICHQH